MYAVQTPNRKDARWDSLYVSESQAKCNVYLDGLKKGMNIAGYRQLLGQGLGLVVMQLHDADGKMIDQKEFLIKNLDK